MVVVTTAWRSLRVVNDKRWRVRLHPARKMCAFLVFVLVATTVEACAIFSAGKEGGRPEASPGTVPTAVSTDADNYYCPGIPDASVRMMFDVSISKIKRDIVNGNKAPFRCGYKIEDGLALEIYYGYHTDNYPPKELVHTAGLKPRVTLKYSGYAGSGELHPGSDGKIRKGTYECGRRFIALDYGYAGIKHSVGDTQEELTNLIQSTLPWVCGDQPIPGADGVTMKSVEPDWLHTSSK